MTGAFKCPECDATTWGDLKHCANCGHPLTVECPNCEGSWRYLYEYKHCPSCGARISKVSFTSK